MKNLDRIYGLSKSQILLDELSSRLNIDYFIRSQSNQLLSSYKEFKRSWDEEDSEYIVRISIFISSQLRTSASETPSVVSLSILIQEIPSLQDFMVKLKDFISIIPLDVRVKNDMQSILSNFAFSLTLFNKFEEIWNMFSDIPGVLKKTAWTLFVLSRVNLIQRRIEVVECACMLVACVFVVLTSCEMTASRPFVEKENEFLSLLCGVIKGQPEQVRISANHLKKMLELFIKHKVVYSHSGVKGVFTSKDIQMNYEKMSFEYVHKLLPCEFDQRVFIDKEVVHFKDIGSFSKFIIKSVLDCEVFPLQLTSELYEVQFSKIPYSEPDQDVNFWLFNTFTDSLTNLDHLKTVLGKLDLDSLLHDNNRILEKIFASVVARPEHSDFTLAAAASLVLYLSVYKTKSFTLAKLLGLNEFTPFELYNEVKKLFNFQLPDRVFRSLRKKNYILMCSFIWSDEQFISKYKTFTHSKKDLGMLEIKDFLSDLLYYSNYTIKEISKSLISSEKIQEEIWMIFKSCLNQECEVLFNRNIHQIIACCIYGLSKAKNLNVTFNSVISRLLEIDPRSEELFRKIPIEDSTGDIIRYYNEEFLRYMKTYLLSVSRAPSEVYSTPLCISNGVPFVGNSVSTPVNNLQFTPGSRKTYEFGKSPVEHLHYFSRMVNKNPKACLNFDEDNKTGQPIKKPKYAEEIYKVDDEIMDIGEIPGFKEENF